MLPREKTAVRGRIGARAASRWPHARSARAFAGAFVALAVLWAGAGSASAAPTLSFSAAVPIDGSPLSAVSCGSESLCVAVDRAGNALTSANAGSPAPGWAAAAVDPGQELSSVSCPSAALCVAVDRRGAYVASLNPASGGWSSPAAVDLGSGGAGVAFTGISCPSSSLCVAVDEAGRVLTSTNPGPGASWSTLAISGSRLRGVSCAAPSSCVAVDEAGTAFASQNPAAGGWTVRTPAPGAALLAVSCFAGGCVAGDSHGEAVASANPWAAPPTWSTTPIDGGGHPAAASCASSGLCALLDDAGNAFASEHGTAALPEWTGSSGDLGAAVTGVSCLASGLCVAVDTLGRTRAGRVPPPRVTTTQPLEVSDSVATLAGVIEPNGAVLTACQFEYGASAGYGSVAPCAGAPSPTGGAQQVSAQLLGLSPNTTYHYRLFAANAGGSQAGGDQTFTTAASSLVQIVFPHPSIGGTPAVGQRLTCRTGIPSGVSARITYVWLRDLLPIANTSGSSYVVRSGDEGFHLQCEVTAANGGGSATAKSAFVTIPVQGVPAAVGETSVGRAQVRNGTVTIPVRCSTLASGGCQVLARLTATETISGGRVVAITAGAPARGGTRVIAARRSRRAAVRRVSVTLAGARAHLGRGQRATLVLALSKAGRKLLASRHQLPATLTVTGTVIGVIQASLAQERLVLGAGVRRTVHHASRHGR